MRVGLGLIGFLVDGSCAALVTEHDGQTFNPFTVVGFETFVQVVFGHCNAVADHFFQRDRGPNDITDVDFFGRTFFLSHHL